MGLPEDQETRLRFFRLVLRKEALRLLRFPHSESDYVVFTKRCQDWLWEELGHSLREIVTMLDAYVSGGGKINEKPEQRSEYAHDEFIYEMRVPIGGRQIYFESILLGENADDWESFTIHVVSVHDV
jgi:hypothetical protein